jgi:hypothetical protein
LAVSEAKSTQPEDYPEISALFLRGVSFTLLRVHWLLKEIHQQVLGETFMEPTGFKKVGLEGQISLTSSSIKHQFSPSPVI